MAQENTPFHLLPTGELHGDNRLTGAAAGVAHVLCLVMGTNTMAKKTLSSVRTEANCARLGRESPSSEHGDMVFCPKRFPKQVQEALQTRATKHLRSLLCSRRVRPNKDGRQLMCFDRVMHRTAIHTESCGGCSQTLLEDISVCFGSCMEVQRGCGVTISPATPFFHDVRFWGI